MKHVIVALQHALHAAAALPDQGQVRPASAVSVEQVLDAAVALGVDAERFERYARLRWGLDWKRDASERRRVLDEIERYRNDPEGFLDKIVTCLNRSGQPG